MKIAALVARVLLGLIFFIFGLNFFYQFLHMPMPQLSAQATAFETGLMGSGYFFKYMKVVEIICGLLLLINRYTALAIVILFPISLNIFLFHTLLAPSGMPMGIAIIILNLFLGYAYRVYYTGMFTAKPTV